jgi:hypothetical protein
LIAGVVELLVRQWSGTLESFTTSIDQCDNKTRDALFAALHRLSKLRTFMITESGEENEDVLKIHQRHFIGIAQCRQLQHLRMPPLSGVKESLHILDPLRARGCDIRITPSVYRYEWFDSIFTNN